MNCVFILLVRLWLWGYCGYCVLCLVGLERVYIFGFWWGRGCWCWCWFLMLHSGNGFSDFIQEVNSKWFLLIVIIVVGVFPFQKQQNQSDTPPPSPSSIIRHLLWIRKSYQMHFIQRYIRISNLSKEASHNAKEKHSLRTASFSRFYWIVGIFFTCIYLYALRSGVIL